MVIFSFPFSSFLCFGRPITLHRVLLFCFWFSSDCHLLSRSSLLWHLDSLSCWMCVRRTKQFVMLVIMPFAFCYWIFGRVLGAECSDCSRFTKRTYNCVNYFLHLSLLYNIYFQKSFHNTLKINKVLGWFGFEGEEYEMQETYPVEVARIFIFQIIFPLLKGRDRKIDLNTSIFLFTFNIIQQYYK